MKFEEDKELEEEENLRKFEKRVFAEIGVAEVENELLHRLNIPVLVGSGGRGAGNLERAGFHAQRRMQVRHLILFRLPSRLERVRERRGLVQRVGWRLIVIVLPRLL